MPAAHLLNGVERGRGDDDGIGGGSTYAGATAAPQTGGLRSGLGLVWGSRTDMRPEDDLESAVDSLRRRCGPVALAGLSVEAGVSRRPRAPGATGTSMPSVFRRLGDAVVASRRRRGR
jgi:hypothetical protein